MRRLLLQLLARFAPRAHAAYLAWWRRGYARAHDAVLQRFGTMVRQGPFAGTRFPRAPFSPMPPMVLGTYEAELHAVIEELVARPYRCVVNVGSAQGYYAVGLARRMPGAHVHAFDPNDEFRRLCAEAARMNGVGDRVSVAAAASAADIQPLLRGTCLVICDCEGAELDVLRPDVAPGLLRADLLVEVHDDRDPTISRQLRSRFQNTHVIRPIQPQPRRARDHPELLFLSRRARHYALLESRGPRLHWLCMTTRRERA
jgi:hypothetical protein